MLTQPPPRLTNKETTIKYLETDLWSWLKNITVGFLNLNFQDNFQSFTVTNLLIPAGQQVAISNQFRARNRGIIPTYRIITRQTGNATIIDGVTPWTADLVYLQNPSGNDATISVIFFN